MPADMLPRCVIAFSNPAAGLGVDFITEDSKAVSAAISRVVIHQNSKRQDKAIITLRDNEMQLLELFSTTKGASQSVSIWLGWADYTVELFSGWVPVPPTASYSASGLVTTTITLSSMSTQVFKPEAPIKKEASLRALIEEQRPLPLPSKQPQDSRSLNPYLTKIMPLTFGKEEGVETIGDLLNKIAEELGVSVVLSISGDWSIPIAPERQNTESLREFLHRMADKYNFRYRFMSVGIGQPELQISPRGKQDIMDIEDYRLHYFKGYGISKLKIPYYTPGERAAQTFFSIKERSCTAVSGFSIKGNDQRAGRTVAKDSKGRLYIFVDSHWYRLNKQALDKAQKDGTLPQVLGAKGILSAIGSPKVFKMIEPYITKVKINVETAEALYDVQGNKISANAGVSFEVSCTVETLGDPAYQPGFLNTLDGIHPLWCGRMWQSVNVEHSFAKGAYTTKAKIRTLKPVEMSNV